MSAASLASIDAAMSASLHVSEGYGSLESAANEDKENGISIEKAEEAVIDNNTFDFENFHSPLRFKTIDQVLEDAKNWPYYGQSAWEFVPVRPKNERREEFLKPAHNFRHAGYSEEHDDYDDEPMEEEDRREPLQFEFDPFNDSSRIDQYCNGVPESIPVEEKRVESPQFEFDPFTDAPRMDYYCDVVPESVPVAEQKVEPPQFEFDPFMDGDKFDY